MSDKGNDGYEAPSVEQVDAGDPPAVTAAGLSDFS
jgi:hypothetical protein